MAAQKGRLFLIKLGASGAGGTLAGLRATTLKINNEQVDITNKDSNGWRQYLEGAGIQSLTLSGDAIASDSATYETVKGYAQANSINTFQIVGPDNDTVEGQFAISDWQESGSQNDALTCTFTLESSGQPTFTNA